MKHWLQLVLLLVRRDLKVRYRGSFAGYLWTMMNPLVLMLVLTFVFSTIGHVQDKFYPIYILSGILCWNVFSQGLLNSSHSIHANGGLLKKVKIPQWVFPSVSIISALTNMLFALVPFVVLAIVLGFPFSSSLFLLPVLIALFFLFLLGIGLFFGAVNVIFRDVGHLLESGMLILFYAAPVAYDVSMVPEKWRFLLQFHPLYFFLKGFRTVLCARPIEWLDWVMMPVLSLGALVLGLFTFRQLRDRIFYYL